MPGTEEGSGNKAGEEDWEGGRVEIRQERKTGREGVRLLRGR